MDFRKENGFGVKLADFRRENLNFLGKNVDFGREIWIFGTWRKM